MLQLAKQTLVDRAGEFLRLYQPQLIGITGSAHTALARKAILHILQDEQHIRSSSYSHHTEEEVAQTVLGATHTARSRSFWKLLIGSKIRELAEQEPDTIVLSLDTNAPGVIDAIAQQYPFTTGILTDVGSEHLDLFDSKEFVAHEMMSLLMTLPKDGYAIINTDDPTLTNLSQRSHAALLTFGRGKDCAVQLVHAEAKPNRGYVSTIRVGHDYIDVVTPHLIFEEQLVAVLIACAVAHTVNQDLATTAALLKDLTPLPHDGEKVHGVGGSILLDFSAHATAETMLHRLDYLHKTSAQRRIAILGDVGELGRYTTSWYSSCGHKAGQVAEVVITVGPEMRRAGSAALLAGADVHHFDTSSEVGKWLVSYLHEGDVVLITGRNTLNMAAAVERLYVK